MDSAHSGTEQNKRGLRTHHCRTPAATSSSKLCCIDFFAPSALIMGGFTTSTPNPTPPVRCTNLTAVIYQQYLASKQQRALHRRSKSMVGHPRTGWNWDKGTDPTQRTQTPKKTASNTPVHTAMSNELQAVIPPASQALLQSQAGPFASRAFTTVPDTTDDEYPSHLTRILLLRRVRLHPPLSARFCWCRRPLDPLGDHRAACAQSGVLRARGGPVERAAARICREGGARVTTNTRLADLNIHTLFRVNDRRIEVIADGLLHHSQERP